MTELLQDDPALQQRFQAYLTRQRRQASEADAVHAKPGTGRAEDERFQPGRATP
jgi:hypothetical protein